MGNICRSPTAEGVFRKLLAEQRARARRRSRFCRHAWLSRGSRPRSARVSRGRAPRRRSQAAARAAGDRAGFRAFRARARDGRAESASSCSSCAPPEYRHRVRLFLEFAPARGSARGARSVLRRQQRLRARPRSRRGGRRGPPRASAEAAGAAASRRGTDSRAQRGCRSLRSGRTQIAVGGLLRRGCLGLHARGPMLGVVGVPVLLRWGFRKRARFARRFLERLRSLRSARSQSPVLSAGSLQAGASWRGAPSSATSPELSGSEYSGSRRSRGSAARSCASAAYFAFGRVAVRCEARAHHGTRCRLACAVPYPSAVGLVAAPLGPAEGVGRGDCASARLRPPEPWSPRFGLIAVLSLGGRFARGLFRPRSLSRSRSRSRSRSLSRSRPRDSCWGRRSRVPGVGAADPPRLGAALARGTCASAAGAERHPNSRCQSVGPCGFGGAGRGAGSGSEGGVGAGVPAGRAKPRLPRFSVTP